MIKPVIMNKEMLSLYIDVETRLLNEEMNKRTNRSKKESKAFALTYQHGACCPYQSSINQRKGTRGYHEGDLNSTSQRENFR